MEKKEKSLLVVEERVLDDLLYAIKILHRMIESKNPSEEDIPQLQMIIKLLKSCQDSKILKL